MKGHTLPGINQRSEGKNMADGRAKSSAFQNTGAFIIDVDEITGKETSKRATYADTRAAEKAGKKVNYTNKEDAKRAHDETAKYNADAKALKTKGDTKGAKTAKQLAQIEQDALKLRMEDVKKNKTSDKEKKERTEDAAFQNQIEKDAKRKKGEYVETRTKSERDIVLNKKDTNKAGDAGTKFYAN